MYIQINGTKVGNKTMTLDETRITLHKRFRGIASETKQVWLVSYFVSWLEPYSHSLPFTLRQGRLSLAPLLLITGFCWLFKSLLGH